MTHPIGHVAEDVQDLIKSVLQALNEGTIPRLRNSRTMKTDKDAKCLIEDVLTNVHEQNEEELNKEETSKSLVKIHPGDGRKIKDLSKVLALASGAALVATSVTATKTRLGSARHVKDAWDINKETGNAGPYSDVTGFEHVQPHSVGRWYHTIIIL